MFDIATYQKRRALLKKGVGSGLIILLGNRESPINYRANTYRFRQDSTFLYYFGIECTDLVGLLDADSGEEFLAGSDPDPEELVWTGKRNSISLLAKTTGIPNSLSLEEVQRRIREAKSLHREIHYLAPYTAYGQMFLNRLMESNFALYECPASSILIRTVVSQRQIKSDLECNEIRNAVEHAAAMFDLVKQTVRPGIAEFEIAGAMEGLLLKRKSRTSFTIICTRQGDVLHNPSYSGILRDGDMLLVDAGAESAECYASDITRTFPVSGSFTFVQREIYELVLRMNQEAIAAIRPGEKFQKVHNLACKIAIEGLKAMGFMQGNTEDALVVGAHALFFPHGLGHALGLDVHDMEALGEDYVGYDRNEVRSMQFGLNRLRFSKAVESGMVLTVEPGIYFIQGLIERWKANGIAREFICYEKIANTNNCRGIRIEDDVLVTPEGCEILSKAIGKTLADAEG